MEPLSLAAALLVVLAAPAFFVLELPLLGFALLAGGLLVAWAGSRGAAVAGAERGSAAGSGSWAGPAAGAASGLGSGSGSGSRSAPRPPSLLRDLSLIAIGLAIVRSIPLAAELDDWSMVKFTLALGGAVAVPYVVSRWVYRDRATGFPWRGRAEETRSVDCARGAAHGGSLRSEARGGAGKRWGLLHWTWLAAVLVLGWLILPWYFISSGVYLNWPDVDDADLIARLFVGVGAVGIWDELFFICTVFAVLLRHFPAWAANLLQAVVFVSFLWELGYRAWGPLLTIPFALVQGYIFLRTHSLAYVVTVHLLFDAVVFAVLVHAHNPQLFDVFLTAP
ncbi:CPBP family intramembrane glutamic endopeptidase [Leucobacter tenebrionis]|uniref:CPBP family intramembrane glutamic endopeptidase n=1 Tax=Leucobacter tenebrionis TaxID=2873270 RepID=UPI001CA798AC|nr:CPBP family intramembrane glutamic endopeptidase [Leucobacter tenebrionis]QZY53540.1 CPBP family intramembrane metalloprotease [Leucobacter tenebrionis]